MRKMRKEAQTKAMSFETKFGPLDHGELVHTINPPFYNPELLFLALIPKYAPVQPLSIKDLSNFSESFEKSG